MEYTFSGLLLAPRICSPSQVFLFRSTLKVLYKLVHSMRLSFSGLLLTHGLVHSLRPSLCGSLLKRTALNNSSNTPYGVPILRYSQIIYCNTPFQVTFWGTHSQVHSHKSHDQLNADVENDFYTSSFNIESE